MSEKAIEKIRREQQQRLDKLLRMLSKTLDISNITRNAWWKKKIKTLTLDTGEQLEITEESVSRRGERWLCVVPISPKEKSLRGG